MQNALTICMQRGLQCFSTGGWEHVIVHGELEDFGKSLSLSCLTAQSRALGQCQMPLFCPVHWAKSSFWTSLHCWVDKIQLFSLLLVYGSPCRHWGRYLRISCYRQLSSKWCQTPLWEPPNTKLFQISCAICFWKNSVLIQKRSNATINRVSQLPRPSDQ